MDWSSFAAGVLAFLGVQAIVVGIVLWVSLEEADRQEEQERDEAIDRISTGVALMLHTGHDVRISRIETVAKAAEILAREPGRQK